MHDTNIKNLFNDTPTNGRQRFLEISLPDNLACPLVVPLTLTGLITTFPGNLTCFLHLITRAWPLRFTKACPVFLSYFVRSFTIPRSPLVPAPLHHQRRLNFSTLYVS